MRDLPNLDFMRSVAVVLVVFSHTALYTGHGDIGKWSGITGVCIFFVHTSLVLMWSLERDPHVGRFYIRRIFRIYPLWLVVLFFTLAVRLPIAPVYAPAFRFYFPTKLELLANVLLTFNFQAGGAKVVGASWSLPIEMQMYVLLPLLFAFAVRFKTVWTVLLLDAFVIEYSHSTMPLMDASLLTCGAYFIPGIIAYVLMKRTELQRIPAWVFPPWLLALVAVAHSYGTFHNSAYFCLALGITIPLFRQMTWSPLKRASATVAGYSYGVYLTHITAIAVSVYLLRDHGLGVRVAAYAILICGLPLLLYHTVESPMIRVGAGLARRIESGRAPRVDERLEPAP